MPGQEFRGKSVEEAIQQALKELRVSQEAVEITVVRRGRAGLFGLGGEEAVVRVEVLETGSLSNRAREVLEGLLHRMGIAAQVHLSSPAEGGLGLSPQIVALDIRGQDLGILIGRQGQTLSSLQYLVNLIVSRGLKGRVPVVVDVEGYKKHRYEALRTLALNLAEGVRRSGEPATLEPMLPFERRLVHLALSSLPDITTESVGEGSTRKVIVRRRRPGEGGPTHPPSPKDEE